jgi:hypothetical protein
MVTNILPPGAGGLTPNLEARFQRSPGDAPRRDEVRNGDRIEISSASLAVVRESVRAGIAQAQAALAIGQDAQAMLVGAQQAVRAGGAEGQGRLEALLSAFAERVEGAVAQGSRLLQGENVLVQAEPGGAPLLIESVDLRLKDSPRSSDILALGADAQIDDPDIGQALQRSIEALQGAMARLLETVRALEAHQGFLGAAEGATLGVRQDLDAESARLLALQVSQGLGASAAPIANAEPRAVLALFRA